MHHSVRYVLLAIAVVIILLGTGFALVRRAPDAVPVTGSEGATQGKESMVRYENPKYHFSFEHPSSLYLKETERAGEQPMLEVVMIKDSPDGRALLEGTAEVPGEMPESVTVSVYANPDRLGAREWAASQTNWSAVANASSIKVGEYDGVTYEMDGLYKFQGVILTQGDQAYAISASYIDPEGQLLRDYGMILNSLSL